MMQKVSVAETWKNLGADKIPLKDSAVEILVAILELHKEVLSSSQELELATNFATVVVADVLVANGVVHVVIRFLLLLLISKILLPDLATLC
jgi:hypothetical protein